MIVHNVTIRESGPDGLVAVLEPHDFPRAIEVEAMRLEAWDRPPCCVEGCGRTAAFEMTIHRLYSRRLSEPTYLCPHDAYRHRTGESVRLRMESHR